MTEKRKYPRIPMKAQVKLMHPDVGEVIVITRDISDGGIFIVTENMESIERMPIGTVLEGQVQGMLADAPILKMEIVRTEQTGFGLRFLVD